MDTIRKLAGANDEKSASAELANIKAEFERLCAGGERSEVERKRFQEVSRRLDELKRIALEADVEREIRRYRALRAIGWTDDLCEGCRRKIWLRAGADDLLDRSRDVPYTPGPYEI